MYEAPEKTVSPRVAFTLQFLAEHPDFIIADAEQGGLTPIGQLHFTRELQHAMKVPLDEITTDERIREQSELYRTQIENDLQGGTLAVDLNPDEIEELILCLQATSVPPESFLLDMISVRFYF